MTTTLSKSTVQIGYDLEQIKGMETPALRAELANALGLTAKHLLYLAAVWTELERRGEDLSGLRSGIVSYLPLIAAGSVVPEAVVRFAGMPLLLRAVTALVPDQQRKIANGEPVLLAVKEGDSYTHRMLPVHALNSTQIRQVFSDRAVRTEAEQIALLSAPPRQSKPWKTERRGNIRADRVKGVIMVGHKPVQPSDLLAALGDLRGNDDQPVSAGDPSVSARLTPEEHERMKQRAASGNTTIATLIRKALQATGMI